MKSYKLWAVFAAASLVLGVVLCIFGITLGGKLHDSFGVQYGKGGSFGIGFIDRDDEDYREKIKLSSFQNLEMDIDLGDITIQQGDELMLYTEDLDSDDFEIIQEGDTLKIKSRDDGFRFFSDGLMPRDYHYTITIPVDKRLSALTIVSGMGDIDVDDIYAQDIVLEQSMGDVSLDNAQYQTLDITQKMGDVDYEGKGQGNMTIDNSMGDVSVTLHDFNRYYSYELNAAMGSIKTSEEKADGVSQSIRNHPKHAKYQLDIDCSMGDIELEFDDDFD